MELIGYHRMVQGFPCGLRCGRFRLVLLAVSVVLLLPALSLQAAPILDYQTTLTLSSDHAASSLPVAVSAGADGEVCVTDGAGACGHLFNGQNLHVFNTGVLAALVDPMDLTPDVSGGFVCTDARAGEGRTICCLNFFGEPVPYEPEKPHEHWYPEHLLITRDGNYLTTDPSDGSLAKHDAASGALLWRKSLRREGEGELLGLGKPAEAPDGRIYLPIDGDPHIVVLSPEGDPLTSFGVSGTSPGRLAFPVGAAFCPDGKVAVLDRMRNVVLVYAPDHSFLAEFGDYGAGPRQFYQPVSIAATPDGRVYVAQGFLARILVFRYLNTESGEVTADRPGSSEASVSGMDRFLPGGRGVPAIESPGSTHLGWGRLTESRTTILQDLQNGGC